MGGDEIAKAGIAGRHLDRGKEDQERDGGDDLRHHQRRVDHGIDGGEAAKWRVRVVASAAMVATMVAMIAAKLAIISERIAASSTWSLCQAD